MRFSPERRRSIAKRRAPADQSGDGYRARRPAAIEAMTSAAATYVATSARSPSSHADAKIVRNGWTSWTCPTVAIPPSASPWYQAKNAEEHADHAHVREADPRGDARAQHPVIDRIGCRNRDEGRCEDERPADHLPARHRAREAPAFRIADRRRRNRDEEQQVGRMRRAAALPQRKRDDHGAAECRAEPEQA